MHTESEEVNQNNLNIKQQIKRTRETSPALFESTHDALQNKQQKLPSRIIFALLCFEISASFNIPPCRRYADIPWNKKTEFHI